MKLKRRYPNYFTGFEETVHEVNSLDDLLNIDWIKNFNDSRNFKKYSISKPQFQDGHTLLMAEYIDENGKHTWWVIGFFIDGYQGIGLDEFVATPRELPKQEPIEHVPYKAPEYNTLDSFIKYVNKD